MRTIKALDDLAKRHRAVLKTDPENAQSKEILALVKELKASRKTLVYAAVPLEVLLGQINTRQLKELSSSFQDDVRKAVVLVRSSLESHNTKKCLADPNQGLNYCDLDAEAFNHDVDIRQEYFGCECHSDEHVFKFQIDTKDGDFVLSVHMSDYRNFFQRLWEGLRYAFGHKSKYGHWDTTQLSLRDIERLHRLTNEAIDFKIAAMEQQEP